MEPHFDLQAAFHIGVAVLAGLAVGIEREWSGHAAGPTARFAGVRTFLVLGLLAGVAGWFQNMGSVVLAGVLIGGGAALTVAAYVVAARRQGGLDVDGTTEAAALAVLGLGTAAGMGHVTLAAGATAVAVLALREKTWIHDAVRRLGEAELRAGLQFAVLALVILPLLPVGPYGPFGGIRPRALWAVVLLLSGINFAGYIARKAVGEAAGYGVTGLLGGLVSSTAVTLTFSQLSRREAHLGRPLGIGVLAAGVTLLPRVWLITLVLNADVAALLTPFFVPPFLAGLALVAVPLARQGVPRDHTTTPEARNPLRLASAIRMALAFQLVLMALHVVNQELGAQGVLWSSALVGLTEMDGLTLAMARLGQRPDMLAVAAKAITIGALANAVLKLSLTVTLGAPAYRRVAGVGLALLTATSAAALWLWW
jgi:uncharacterized membrane protein (DUF4010 family)